MTDADIAQGASLAEQALPIGTVLSGDQFTITGHLGAGGFGITYRATDNMLGRTIVIKECFPEDLCMREGKDVVVRNNAYEKQIRSVVKMFMREARSLAKLRHPNIVGVHRAFEENGTAYMALDLIDGRDLLDILDANATQLSPARVTSILVRLLDAIEKVHELGLLHRDISPDNIILERTGAPVLIDFGAARADASRHTRAVSAFLVVKDGYSPQEFYVAGSEQAPCSDLYALAATFYHVISGKQPPNSQSRLIEIAGNRPDPCEPLAGRIEGYDRAFLQAIDDAMQIHPNDRPQTAAKWRSMIAHIEQDAKGASTSSKPTPAQDISLDLEMELTRLVEETNDEVRKSRMIPVEPKVVAPPKEEPSKPAWVEEFNQESLEPVADEDDWDFDFVEEARAEAAYVYSEPKPAPTENWIDRALEKQERIRSERESQLEALETSSRARSKVSTQPAEASEDLIEEIIPPDAPPNKNRPLGILVGLVFGICMFFIWQNY
ncbi:MAG: serine/threonine-protein kinase [Paracoccaceae bacterium]|nr:serine/threonine-protein kinase [Paracoccaceae bacterium]